MWEPTSPHDCRFQRVGLRYRVSTFSAHFPGTEHYSNYNTAMSLNFPDATRDTIGMFANSMFANSMSANETEHNVDVGYQVQDQPELPRAAT